MRKSRFSEEQTLKVMKLAESGAATPNILRRHGISNNTFYRWKAKYGGLEISEATRLKHLEDSIFTTEPRAVPSALIDRELLAQRRVFQGEGRSGADRSPEEAEQS